MTAFVMLRVYFDPEVTSLLDSAFRLSYVVICGMTCWCQLEV